MGRLATRILRDALNTPNEERMLFRAEHQAAADSERRKRKNLVKRAYRKIEREEHFEYQLMRGSDRWPKKKVMTVIESYIENKRFRESFINRGMTGHLWQWKLEDEEYRRLKDMKIRAARTLNL